MTVTEQRYRAVLEVQAGARVPGHVGRVMRPGAFFDFTFDRTETEEHHVLRENFYYTVDTLLDLARSHGFTAQLVAGWEELPHNLSKIRAVRPG